jgi:retron-type reverse transcriptase
VKRYGNLFEQAFTMESLHQAYRDARKGKRKKRAYHRFSASLGANIFALHNELHSGSYHPQPYFEFDVYEPKQRRIYAPAFRDVVVQHAIYRQIYPIFDRTFIDTSFACRKRVRYAQGQRVYTAGIAGQQSGELDAQAGY